MLPVINDARKMVIFPETATEFAENAKRLLGTLESEGDRRAAGDLAAELYLDLVSYLPNWRLSPLVDAGKLAQKDVDSLAEALAGYVRRNAAQERIAGMETEAGAIRQSQTRMLCERTRQGGLFTFWGHDYCTGMDHSLRRGARFVTSNPAKINLFRKENPELWDRLLAEARRENPGVTTERLISAMFVKVTAINARVLYPIFEATGGKDGFVCVQTNPKNINDSEKMLEEVLYWEQAYRKELAVDRINIVYKLPAVKAAEKTAAALVAKGIRVCLTLNFTVSQHEVFADIIQRGTRNGFVVLMSGFLDDNVAKELESLDVADAKRYARYAGVAVMRKSYANLRARGCTRVMPMAAAIRGDYTIRCCLTDHADAPVYFTTMTAKIQEFDSEPRRLVSEMEEAIPEEIMAGLRKSDIFNQAYNRDRLDMDQVGDFIPLQAVLRAFTEAYVEIEKSLS